MQQSGKQQMELKEMQINNLNIAYCGAVYTVYSVEGKRICNLQMPYPLTKRCILNDVTAQRCTPPNGASKWATKGIVARWGSEGQRLAFVWRQQQFYWQQEVDDDDDVASIHLWGRTQTVVAAGRTLLHAARAAIYICT